MFVTIGCVILGVVIGGAAFLAWASMRRRSEVATGLAAQNEAERILEDAKAKTQLLIKEAELKAKDVVVGAARRSRKRNARTAARIYRARKQARSARGDVRKTRWKRSSGARADLNRRDAERAQSREELSADKEAEHQALIDEARTRLEAVAGLTREEAKRTLIDEMVGAGASGRGPPYPRGRGRGARGSRPTRQTRSSRSRSSGWRANSSPSARSRCWRCPTTR